MVTRQPFYNLKILDIIAKQKFFKAGDLLSISANNVTDLMCK